MNHFESLEQQALVEWALMMKGRYPDLDMLYAVPNGGKRNIVEAVRLKKEGVRPGVPDMVLASPRYPYHGLYIELKIEGSTTSSDQKKWIDKLIKQGYKAEVCKGWERASKVILQYLEG